MENNFEKAFQFTIGAEGNYSNDPQDPGGETKFGISKRSYPSLDIKNLTLDQAKQIYLVDYWGKMGCDDLPFLLDIFAFDASVNQGVGAAKKLIEKSQSPCQFLVERIGYYVDLAERSENAKKYFRGWINRTIKLYRNFKETV
jgi:lysozyme family protein